MNNQIRPLFLSIVCGLVLAAVSGCATYEANRVPSGLIDQKGVVIRSESGTFSLESGKRFQTPFHSRCYNLPGDPMLRRSEDWGTGPESYADAEKDGARRVRVLVKGRSKWLYGVLAFCVVPDTASGPASRSYNIKIPERTLANATDGRIAVAWENIDWTSRKTGDTKTWRAWVLWLSDQPLP